MGDARRVVRRLVFAAIVAAASIPLSAVPASAALTTPDLAIDVTADPVTHPGDLFRVDASVTNGSAVSPTAVDVSLDLTFPEGVRFVSVHPDAWTCEVRAAGDPDMRCTMPALLGGDPTSVSVIFELPATDQGSETLTASAVVSAANEDEGDERDNADSADIDVEPAPDVAVTVEAAAERVAPGSGEAASFTVTVRNDHDEPATDTLATVEITGGELLELTDGWTCDAGICTRQLDLEAEASEATTFDVAVPSDAAAGRIDASATIEQAVGNADADNDTDVASVDITPLADVLITLEAPERVAIDQPVWYRAEVTNDGPSTATDVAVRFDLPAGTEYDDSASTEALECDVLAEQVVCELLSLAPGVTKVAYLDVMVVSTSGDVTGTATVTTATPQPEGATSNDTETARTIVSRLVDLGISVTGPDSAEVGDEVTFHVSVHNDGPDVGLHVVAATHIPEGAELVAAEDCEPGDEGELFCSIVELVPGDSFEWAVTYRLTAAAAGSTLVMAWDVASIVPEEDIDDNFASVETSVAAASTDDETDATPAPPAQTGNPAPPTGGAEADSGTNDSDSSSGGRRSSGGGGSGSGDDSSSDDDNDDPMPAPRPAPSAPSTSTPPSSNTAGSSASSQSGYWMLGRDGSVYAFGDAAHHGNAATGSAVDIARTPSGRGYWVVDAAGAVSAFGDAADLGDAGPLAFGERAVSIAAAPNGAGYWVFTSAGRVFAMGTAAHAGDLAGQVLNAPIIDAAATPSGRGYYLAAADGGLFAFGDARFHGSMGGQALGAPVVGLVPDRDGTGYWLVGADGGVYAFAATFRGSMGGTRLNQPIGGMVSFGNGYLMVASDGGVFTFSDRRFDGSLGGQPPAHPIVSATAI